ncbi:MAG: hypothetical protein JWO90_1913 [Solirubrobacterales bacterium]|jgi:uncharacterized membrane protein YhaH (DUF805 family)|nr:hypothetical protein [Solirubrobacterales bacterium]
MTTLRELFWVLALGIIGCFVFFFALGAISLTDAIGVTVLVGVLCLLWAVHGATMRHHVERRHDPRLTHARERRGF